MNSIHFIQAAPTNDAIYLSPAHMTLPEPELVCRPVKPIPTLRPPRSAKRTYSSEELATAAAMLAKLRRREDLGQLVRSEDSPVSFDQQKVLDVVVEKLLRKM